MTHPALFLLVTLLAPVAPAQIAPEPPAEQEPAPPSPEQEPAPIRAGGASDLVPADALAVLEARDPVALWRGFADSLYWKRASDSPLYRALEESPGGAVVVFLRGAALQPVGGDPLAFLDAFAGGGLAIALLPGEEEPTWIAAARPRDADLAQECLAPLIRFASGGEREPAGVAWTVTLDEIALRRDGALFLAGPDRAALARIGASPPVTTVEGYQEMHARTRPGALRLWMRGDLLRADGITEKPEDVVGSLLAAELHETLRHAPWAAGALRLEKDGIHADLFAPMPDALAITHAPFFPLRETVTLPALDERMATAVLARDLGAWWTAREEYLMPRAVADSVEGDGNLSLLFGRDLGSEVLAHLRPEIRLIVARNPEAADRDLEIELPAAALGLRLNEDAPQDLDAAFANAFLAGVLLSGVQGGELGADPLLIDVELREDGRKVYLARYRPWEGGEAPLRHNLSPAMTVRDDGEIWIATSRALLDRVLDAPVEQVPLSNVRMDVHGAPVVALLERIRPALVARRLLREGGDVEAAERFADLVIAGARIFDRARLTTARERGMLHLRLDLDATP